MKDKKLAKGLEKRNARMEQLHSDYYVTFGTEAGQRVLHDLKKITGYDRQLSPTDISGKIDENMLLLEVGSRNVFTKILSRLKKWDNSLSPESE